MVSRKGIETSIELVSRLELPKCALVIPHEAGDEGFAYRQRVEDYAKFMGVDLRLIPDRIAKERGVGPDGCKSYTLWDVYPHADLISYPSIYEGYGNAFVEAIYFRKPIFMLTLWFLFNFSAKSYTVQRSVIPADAGIHHHSIFLDSGVRRNDGSDIMIFL